MLSLWLGEEKFLNSVLQRTVFGLSTSVGSGLRFWFLIGDSCVPSWIGQKSSNFLLAQAGGQISSRLHSKFRAWFVENLRFADAPSSVSASCPGLGCTAVPLSGQNMPGPLKVCTVTVFLLNISVTHLDFSFCSQLSFYVLFSHTLGPLNIWANLRIQKLFSFIHLFPLVGQSWRGEDEGRKSLSKHSPAN